MNKKLMRIISAVMAICLLACMIVPAASAMPQESADGSIKRISVVINGDAKNKTRHLLVHDREMRQRC